jgi:flagellar hook-associated protein 1 FlgK
MSLFGSIQLGANTLQAMQIGLQVTGNNIANANTPGYVRQQVVYSPAPVQRIGNLVLGLGVQVEGIVDKIDKFVLDRLVGARGDRAGAEVQEDAYHELESLLNGLSGTVDLGTTLNSFFNSIGEVLNDPTSAAARNLVVGQGGSLAGTINSLANRAQNLRGEFNDRVNSAADEINNLAEEVRRLNIQIATVEGGGSSSSDAGGLRVQRREAVDRLSELLGITVNEQASGAANISVGGEFLVFEGQRRAVTIKPVTVDGISLSSIQFADTNSALTTNSGELQGLYTARDQIVGDFLEGLDELSSLLAFEFNKVYSQGQGLSGFTQLTSVHGVANTETALDEAGLDFTPVNGEFQFLVYNKAQDTTKTYDIRVDLNGLDDDTSLNDLAAAINAVDGISASVTPAGRLQIAADSSDTEFAFADDTSGVLAALGLNTFFTGSSALDIGVNAELVGLGNEAKFAASLGGIGRNADTENAVRLFAFLETPLAAAGGNTLPDVYDRLINSVSQGATVAKSVAEGYRVFEGTLDGQLQSVGGVSLDEEAIQLITLQRIYQASARFIQVAAELLDVLVNL